ncbi:MAG: cytochrome c3 family protein, partial [Novosphingobium sp.]
MGGFRLRTIEVTADGRPIVRNRDLAGASATIGRAAENTLHLPDLALDPRHAVLTLEPDGRVRAEAAGTLGFGLDGRSVTSGIIDPANGGELGFGGYRIAVSRDEDGAVLLTVSEHQAPEASANFTLAGLLPGRRVLSWSFIAAILALFLAWPIASNLARDPADKTQRVGGDAAWSSGPLSFAHRTLSDKCEACHVKPFEAVR